MISPVYAQKHQGGDAVARYQRKLSNRIDRIRHGIELDLLRRHARGHLFDCTLGTGRFVGLLPGVSAYSGTDISAEFVAHVQASHPDVEARVGDLTKGIDAPDSAYDCVICLRSLSGIGHLATILPEMVRITRPGGTIVLDYGRKAVEVVLNGQRTVLDGEDLDGVLSRLDADIVERRHCDAVLTRIKRVPRLFRLLNGRFGRFVPDAFLVALERAVAPMLWERQIIVLRKRGLSPR